MANGERDILSALQSIRRKVQNPKNEPDVVALLTEKGKIDLGVKIGEIR